MLWRQITAKGTDMLLALQTVPPGQITELTDAIQRIGPATVIIIILLIIIVLLVVLLIRIFIPVFNTIGVAMTKLAESNTRFVDVAQSSVKTNEATERAIREKSEQTVGAIRDTGDVTVKAIGLIGDQIK